MIPLKAIFVISVLVSGLIFSPSYSFAQSDQDNSPLSSLLEIFRQFFSFEDEPSQIITEFRPSVILQTGGSSSTSDTTENNILPTANAGPDQNVLEFATVTLDGSSSTDVDGTIVSYQWTQISDPPVDLSSTSESNTTFIAPEVESDDLILRFSLEVKDNSGGTATDEVDITVKNVNAPPTANAGPDQNVLEFATVTLDGSSSTDVDGTIVSYQWTQISDPPVDLSSTSESNTTFIAPEVDSKRILKFSLTVTDNSGDTDMDDVEITVNEIDDGTNDDGTNDDGTNDDGTNDDGTNDDGTNDDGTNDDGTNDDGTNDDGTNDDGTNDDGTNDDGTNDDTVNITNNEDKKVTICHVPPGNPNNSHTIRVGGPAVNAHLAHGDSVGACDGNSINDDVDNTKNNPGKSNSNVGNPGKGNQNKKDKNENKSNSGKGNNNKNDDNENKKSNSAEGNSNVGNPGKGNQNKNDKNENKSNSGKGNNNKNDDNENKKSNSAEGNSNVGNPGKGNQNKNDKNENKSNSGKKIQDENDDENDDENEDENED